MLTNKLFFEFIEAASLASSADNMQPWEFRKLSDKIEVFFAQDRCLPTDVNNMFACIGIGAAIQNIVIAAADAGFVASIEYSPNKQIYERAAIIKFTEGKKTNNNLVQYLHLRTTNRSPYQTSPLKLSLRSDLTTSVQKFNAGLHWTTNANDFKQMAKMDANLSYIRLEHKPFNDELFNILRFTNKENENKRYGLDFKSLEVPPFATLFARQLQNWTINKTISRLGIGRLVAKRLASRLRKAGAICLMTAFEDNAEGYMEAGRAMQNIWLAASANGLSVQPYGVLPQYLNKIKLEPGFFLPKHLKLIQNQHDPFYSIFPEAKNEYPAIVLRIGKTNLQPANSNIRLKAGQIIRR